MRKYPIGIQTFEEIIREGYVYVDKTDYIWNLTQTGKYYFLSRPRRFGKSLLISTLEAFYRGRRELFKGLAIDSKDYDWQEYPVLHLDMNTQDYSKSDEALDEKLETQLSIWEDRYGVTDVMQGAALRFESLIRLIFNQTGQRVVILIDEYDKPLLANLFNKERSERFRSALKAFYGVLKSCDRYIKFAFLTGVTKFGKVSVFSDLNNLEDITLNAAYNAVCGISETELTKYFDVDIKRLADKFGVSREEMAVQLRINYDGYHFTREHSEGIYNPFSLLNVFKSASLDDFWFMTGTPTMLVRLLERSNTDLTELEGTERSGIDLMGLDPVFRDPIPVIFQSGYLTIKGYDMRRRRYRLGFPNEEVKRGFLEALLPAYIDRDISAGEADIFRLLDALEDGDADLYLKILQSFMAGIPYSEESARIPERRFSDIMYVTSSLIGLNVEAEHSIARGRIDLLVKTDRYIYIMEFKVDKSPEEALAQIEEKGYAAPYLTDERTLIRVGVEFSTLERNISRWIVEQT